MRIYLLSSWLWLLVSLPLAAQELVFGYSLDGSPVSSTQIIQGHPTGKASCTASSACNRAHCSAG